MDLIIFEAIHGLVGVSRLLDWAGVVFASYLPYVLVLTAIVALVHVGEWRDKIRAWVTTLLSVLLARWVCVESFRFFSYRPRPFFVLDFSPLISELSTAFPSGHATLLFALAGGVFSFNRRVGMWLFIGAAINGLSRVFVGVHWPSDILGGVAIGLLSVILVRFLIHDDHLHTIQTNKTAFSGQNTITSA